MTIVALGTRQYNLRDVPPPKGRVTHEVLAALELLADAWERQRYDEKIRLALALMQERNRETGNRSLASVRVSGIHLPEITKADIDDLFADLG